VTEPRISVVVPARDAAATLAECLAAITAQRLPRDEYELIVVVDLRSTDATAAIAHSSAATVVEIRPDVGDARYTAGARNAGIRRARGEWVAFTDADCVPSRGWLRALLSAADKPASEVLGIAGLTLGIDSRSPAARYVDLTGGLRSDRHLAHERYPWPVAGNVMYRRAALLAVGGYDDRFASYEQADLHLRLMRAFGGTTPIVERAVVGHRHRTRWSDYWRQQMSYGTGYAQFFLRYEDELSWSVSRELRAWTSLAPLAIRALIPGKTDAAIIRRGNFLKRAAQRTGFARTYWSRREAARWREPAQARPEPGA
jgi:glycosyltransferase involved in cell wall biosynthesis